jgi:hypothetical protein
MKKLIVFLLVTILTGCAAATKEQKSEVPLREKFEKYWARMQAVPEFTRGGEMREAGHLHSRNAYNVRQIDDIIYEWDKAIECFSKAADLYFEGKAKHPEFSEYADAELDLTYMFIEECIKERPFLISPIKGETLGAGGLTHEQRLLLESLQERIRQYEAAQIK